MYTIIQIKYLAHVVDKTCPAHVCKNLLAYYIDPEICRKCGICAKGCPTSAISGVLGKEPYYIDEAKCIRCGACITNCPFEVIVRI